METIFLIALVITLMAIFSTGDKRKNSEEINYDEEQQLGQNSSTPSK